MVNTFQIVEGKYYTRKTLIAGTRIHRQKQGRDQLPRLFLMTQKTVIHTIPTAFFGSSTIKSL